ncbi:MAG: sigma-70 family RNA polymerase sigma factor, partial [Betaproteobacteria bacterium]
MRIDVRRLGEADLVLVEGALDLATKCRLHAVLDARLNEGRTELVVDLDRVRLLDAGTVGTLIRVAERAEAAGGALRAIGARGLCLDVLQIVGVEKRLYAYEEPADILERFQPDPADDSAYGEINPRWPGSRDITVHGLLSAAALLPPDSADRAELRTQAIEDNLGLAQRLARRFRDRGEPVDDLIQVAMVGLVNAVDGYDPQRGCEFGGYATPTIVGEIRRYFRDKGWRIKVPRR